MREYRHIVRIAGKDIDGTKKLVYGLTNIKGVGISLANAIVNALNLNPNLRIGNLTEEDVAKIEGALSDPLKYGLPTWLLNRGKDLTTGRDVHLIGSDLELRTKMDIDLMKSIKSWKGVRHALGLKVRGQRTRTTGRKGKTVGVRKKRR
ncbi:TPA: 30S ribosomal protein S13 [Candidatus Bathyarchaeota archaeon]|nr:30S ribosomal protein S13 [Candidatus Bathyarchaeota archaeon]